MKGGKLKKLCKKSLFSAFPHRPNFPPNTQKTHITKVRNSFPFCCFFVVSMEKYKNSFILLILCLFLPSIFPVNFFYLGKVTFVCLFWLYSYRLCYWERAFKDTHWGTKGWRKIQRSSINEHGDDRYPGLISNANNLRSLQQRNLKRR